MLFYYSLLCEFLFLNSNKTEKWRSKTVASAEASHSPTESATEKKYEYQIHVALTETKNEMTEKKTNSRYV